MVRAVVVAACMWGCGFEPGRAPDAGRMDDGSIDSLDAVDSSNNVQCPATYSITLASSTSHYRAIVTNASFWVHDATCNAAAGTHLAVIDSQAELTELTKVLVVLVVQPTNSWYLVGCVQAPFQALPDQMWHWFTGPSVPVYVWGFFNSMQQPNDADGMENGAENLGVLDAMQGKLIDGTGANPSGYGAVCECDGLAMDATIRGQIPPMP